MCMCVKSFSLFCFFFSISFSVLCIALYARDCMWLYMYRLSPLFTPLRLVVHSAVSVPGFGPSLPAGGVFCEPSAFRDFLLTKCQLHVVILLCYDLVSYIVLADAYTCD